MTCRLQPTMQRSQESNMEAGTEVENTKNTTRWLAFRNLFSLLSSSVWSLAQGWDCPKLAGSSAINHSSGNASTDLNTGQSSVGNYTTEVPSFQGTPIYIKVTKRRKKEPAQKTIVWVLFQISMVFPSPM